MTNPTQHLEEWVKWMEMRRMHIEQATTPGNDRHPTTLPSAGDTLPNGSTLLKIRTKPNGSTYILWCERGEFKSGLLAENDITLLCNFHGTNLSHAIEMLATR